MTIPITKLKRILGSLSSVPPPFNHNNSHLAIIWEKIGHILSWIDVVSALISNWSRQTHDTVKNLEKLKSAIFKEP